MTDTAPPAVLDYLNTHARTGIDGGVTFHDDNGTQHIALDREGCPPMTAREVAAWTRVHRPELWGSKTTKAETAPSSAQTAADLMAAVCTGQMTANDAAARLLSARPAETRPAPGIPDAPTFAGDTMTALMAKAKAGDKSAIAAITAKYLNPNRYEKRTCFPEFTP